jgi:hypothetical protein
MEVSEMKNKLFILAIVFVLSLLIVLPVAAGISGPGVSGIQIQNLDTQNSANVQVQLWNQNGSSAITISGGGGDSIPMSSAKTYYLPDYSNVPDGAYAMVVSSDKPIAAIARTEWQNSGGGATYISMPPGKDIIIPSILSNYAGQTSQFTIQNTNTSSSINDIKITLNGRGLTSAVRVLNGETIPAGTSKSYNLADPVWCGGGSCTLPNTALDLGAEGFVGSIRIESSTDLVVQSFIDVAQVRSVSSFSGVPTNSAATTVFCPLIRANYYGDTGISIVNPNSTEVNVTITFDADAASPNSGTTYTQDISVSGNSSNLAFQGPGGNSRQSPTNLPGGTQNTSNPNYTNNGFFGVARLVSTGGPILAVVNDVIFASNWKADTQGTYNCLTENDAGAQFALPSIRKYHLQTTKLTTGVSIQNITGNSVQVGMEIYNHDGARMASADPAPITIPAYGSGNFYQGDLTNVPTGSSSVPGGYGWFGSAILKVNTQGGKVVVLVNDQGFGTTKIDSANYEGLLLPTP